ncbi:D-alanyl-D-alanine carboxypeptidase [Patescibacteria group bacterium]|nr:D-alanyl-D-alanine carboxypeptidase [Patescibacteria group bacterium]
MRKMSLALGLSVGFALLMGRSVLAATPLPTFSTYTPQPDEFVSAIVMVPKTHEVLYSFKPDLIHPTASLTKLPAALAFLSRNISTAKSIRLAAVDEVGGGRLRVSVGARMTVRDLVYSSITASANNTATALGRLSGLTKSAFLKRMNEEARLAGAIHSKFVDFSGMDSGNVTTAHDMALIADRAFSEPTIRRAATTAQYSFKVYEGTKTINKTIKNTNDLLTKDPDVWVLGGKTGYLEEAKNNLAVRLRRLDSRGTPIAGTDVIVVVFGVTDKQQMFASAKRLANWSWEQHAF